MIIYGDVETFGKERYYDAIRLEGLLKPFRT